MRYSYFPLVAGVTLSPFSDVVTLAVVIAVVGVVTAGSPVVIGVVAVDRPTLAF